MFGKKKQEQSAQFSQKTVSKEIITVNIRSEGLITATFKTILYDEIIQENGNQKKREIIIIEEGKVKYKLEVETTKEYALPSTQTRTIYIDKNIYSKERYKQLSLKDMRLLYSDDAPKPIHEDQGKVLAKILQDNINAKQAPPSIIAGMTKGFFWMFIAAVLIFAGIYGLNLWSQTAYVAASQNGISAIQHYLALQSSPVP